MLLALDTSTAATVVGVGSPDGTLLAERRHDPAEGERPGHMTQLLTLAEDALGEAGLSWGDLTRLGAGSGPGGFTGLRIGLATGRSLAAGLGVELVGVGSLDALAFGHEGTAVLALLDARRAEVFGRPFDERGQPQSAPFAAEPGRLGERCTITGATVLGDGAIRYRNLIEAAGADIPPDDDPRHRIRASALLALAAQGAAGTAATDTPTYLREPDAVPKPR